MLKQYPRSIIQAGRFIASIETNIDAVYEGIHQVYSPTSMAECEFADFHIQIKSKRQYRKQAIFSFNGHQPFSPLPYNQGFPLLEWALNWCVTAHYHNALVVHAAVVEKNGKVLILPGSPGSGKSTLCAALITEGGWRLFSDELALIDLQTGYVYPNPRPVSLKNQSIDIIKHFSPKSHFTPAIKDTIKGTVAHMCPLSNGHPANFGACSPAIILFPKYMADKEEHLQTISSGYAFMQIVENSFNYHVLGLAGFKAISSLMDHVKCYRYEYNGDLHKALSLIDELIDYDC